VVSDSQPTEVNLLFTATVACNENMCLEMKIDKLSVGTCDLGGRQWLHVLAACLCLDLFGAVGGISNPLIRIGRHLEHFFR